MMKLCSNSLVVVVHVLVDAAVLAEGISTLLYRAGVCGVRRCVN